eukprot:TRINITY_DN3665_c0_g1_i1.p1 TRINITY_DN3665_c0_g1~~TRINITY_DN3665_c0_g1_i1.p1  ORF type:complete len:938 (-),score=200.65 TRINITY_DN3665_c0_g1_i1:99-2912(-)
MAADPVKVAEELSGAATDSCLGDDAQAQVEDKDTASTSLSPAEVGAALSEPPAKQGQHEALTATEVVPAGNLAPASVQADDPGSLDQDVGSQHTQAEILRAQVARLTEELEEATRENDVLRNRCAKLARAAAGPLSSKADAEVQTETNDAGSGGAADSEANSGTAGAGLLPPAVEQMLRSPNDEAVQIRCIEALFAEQTQMDGGTHGSSTSALRASLEAAVAIFSNHAENPALLLKASQFLSVLLAEPNAEENLPLAVLFQAAQDVVMASGHLLESVAVSGLPVQGKAGSSPNPTKLLTWFLSLLALLLPCLGPRLRDRAQGEAFLRDFLSKLTSPLLASAEFRQEALILKCVQLIPVLPMEPWIQKACLETGAVHALALAFHQHHCVGGVGGNMVGDQSVPATESPLRKAVRAAVRCVFSQNLELCIRALDDTFVTEEFVCVEVLDELRGVEKKQRGNFLILDSEWGLSGKALGLWAWHQRKALEDADPLKSPSREVLQKVAELLRVVLPKLPARRLLDRMQEFKDAEALQRIALATIHGNAQLRLQVAVNYLDNGIIPVVISCMQMFLRRYEVVEWVPADSALGDTETAFRLLQDERVPPEGWPYILFCLDICLHVLSHWSATKASLRHKADVLDARAAPLLLAQGGLVDVLAELVDPTAAGTELNTKPPQTVSQKACETLQALFEQNGHICLFCMQHYTDVRQMVALGCESLAADPLAEFPDMQQQAVVQLAASFEKFAIEDERMGRKILKALCMLFESSYHLVAWFLKSHTIANMTELQSLDVHTEALKAVVRAPYWSSTDAPLLPEFVTLIGQLLLGCIEGLSPEDVPQPRKGRRVLDLTEALEVVDACMSAVLHLLLIDPSPPTVLHCLVSSLGGSDPKADVAAGEIEDPAAFVKCSEQAVGAVMRVMQIFPSSDSVQMNCQHLLTSLLGE